MFLLGLSGLALVQTNLSPCLGRAPRSFPGGVVGSRQVSHRLKRPPVKMLRALATGIRPWTGSLPPDECMRVHLRHRGQSPSHRDDVELRCHEAIQARSKAPKAIQSSQHRCNVKLLVECNDLIVSNVPRQSFGAACCAFSLDRARATLAESDGFSHFQHLELFCILFVIVCDVAPNAPAQWSSGHGQPGRHATWICQRGTKIWYTAFENCQADVAGQESPGHGTKTPQDPADLPHLFFLRTGFSAFCHRRSRGLKT